jgi:hypothetical protein
VSLRAEHDAVLRRDQHLERSNEPSWSAHQLWRSLLPSAWRTVRAFPVSRSAEWAFRTAPMRLVRSLVGAWHHQPSRCQGLTSVGSSRHHPFLPQHRPGGGLAVRGPRVGCGHRGARRAPRRDATVVMNRQAGRRPTHALSLDSSPRRRVGCPEFHCLPPVSTGWFRRAFRCLP